MFFPLRGRKKGLSRKRKRGKVIRTPRFKRKSRFVVLANFIYLTK